MTSDLRTLMHDLAEDVVPVNLRGQVMATSRTLARRRTAATGVAVTAVLGSVGLVVANGMPGGRVVVPAISSSSAVPSGVVTNFPAPRSTRTAYPTFPTLYFVDNPADTHATRLRILRWTPGENAPTTLAQVPSGAFDNVNVSPDGHWLSWVDSDGTLWVQGLLAPGQPRAVRSHVDGKLFEPIWARDSKRLLISDISAAAPGSGRIGTLDVGSSTFTPLPRNLVGARHAAWATDGKVIGYVDAQGRLIIADPDGSHQTVVRNPDRSGTVVYLGVCSLSADDSADPGRQAYVHMGPPDQLGAPRDLVGNYDTDTPPRDLIQYDGFADSLNDRHFDGVFEGGLNGELFEGTFPGIAGYGGQVSVWWDGKRHYAALVGAANEYFGSAPSPAGLEPTLMLSR